MVVRLVAGCAAAGYLVPMPLPTPGQLAIIFAILFVLFRALEFCRPKAERTPLFRRGLLTDIAYWIFNPLLAEAVIRALLLLIIAVVALLIYGRIEKSEILAGYGPLAQLPPAVQGALMLIVADFIVYWTHRTFHQRPRLWRFHAIHHAPTTLDWLSAARVHPVNELVGRLALVTALLPLGFKPQTLAWAGPIFSLYALFLHANLNWDYGRLRTVIASPRFHRWHHTSEAEGRDKNFAGLFPIWDILFGTYYMPPGRVPRVFGTDTSVPSGLLAQLAFPFRRSPLPAREGDANCSGKGDARSRVSLSGSGS